MATDERITANEWDKNKECAICRDIAEGKIDLEGEQLFDDPAKKKPMFCPKCGFQDIRIFHEVGGVESQASSTRGDTQPWTHLIIVRCMSCQFNFGGPRANYPCLGNPWDEVMGFKRPEKQSTDTQHAIQWSNEQAVGLRGAREKYDKSAKLKSKTYRSRRKVEWDEEPTEGERTLTFELTDEEKTLPKFRKNKKQED
jgi:hypothetical protein